VYSGDQNFAQATIPISTFNIINPSILITSSPSSLAVSAGTPGSVTLTLQGLVGFGGTQIAVTLACDTQTLPKYSECSFNNPNVPMTVSNGSAQVVLTISSNVPVNSGALRKLDSGPETIVFAGMFGLGMFGLLLRRRTRFHPRMLAILCVALFGSSLLGVIGCTNAGYTQTPPTPVVTTPSGTSNVTVTATSNGAVVSLPFALPVTVN
jgi:hypothetical protein